MIANQASINQFKDWLRQTLAWHKAESDNILRMGAAQGMGIDPQSVNRPFPGSPGPVAVTTTNLQPPPSSPAPASTGTAAPTAAPSNGGLPGWAKSLLLTLSGAAAGLGVAYLGLRHHADSPTTAAAPATVPSVSAGATSKTTIDPIEVDVEYWWDKDGNIHFGQATPVKPGQAPTPAPRKP